MAMERANDLRAFNDDARVVNDTTLAVKHGAGSDNDLFRLALRKRDIGYREHETYNQSVQFHPRNLWLLCAFECAFEVNRLQPGGPVLNRNAIRL